MFRSRRSRILVFAGLLMIAAALAGCSSAAEAPATSIIPSTTDATATTAPTAEVASTSTPDMADMTETGTPTAAQAAATPTPEPTLEPTTAPAAEATATPTAQAGGQTTSGPIQVQATLREWGLDLSQSEVAAGAVHFVVNNTGTMAHNFTIKDANGVIGQINAFSPGQSPQTLDVTLTPGTYTVYCSLPGHAARGQQNTLSVK